MKIGIMRSESTNYNNNHNNNREKGGGGKTTTTSTTTTKMPGDGGDEDGGVEKFVHCALLGDGMVGKTCLTLSYTQQLFTDRYTATVFDNYSVPLSVGGENFVISLFDTAGQSDYESVRAYTYQESEVLVLCFSVCDRESFCSVVGCWLPEIRRHTKRHRPLLLVGTQIDLRPPQTSASYSNNSSSLVSTEEGRQLAKLIGADCYIECSARSQEGLRQVFEHVVFSALKYRRKKGKILTRLFGGERTLSNKSIRNLAAMLQATTTSTTTTTLSSSPSSSSSTSSSSSPTTPTSTDSADSATSTTRTDNNKSKRRQQLSC